MAELSMVSMILTEKDYPLTPIFHFPRLELSGALNRLLGSRVKRSKPTQNAYVERFNRTVRHEWEDYKSIR